MGGPSDLALTLQFVSGAIGSYTAVYPAIAVPPESNETVLYGTEGVMSIVRYRLRIARPDGTIEEHRLEEAEGGYYNELLNFYDATVYGEPLVGTVAQSVHTMQIVLAGLDSAKRGQAVSMDGAPGGLAAQGVPLWRPRGASGLFDGLPSRIVSEVRRD
jgi:hypothetical protein